MTAHEAPQVWLWATWGPPIKKEDADCCMIVAGRDPLGRPPIGWCGPDCERRAAHLRRYAA